MEITFPRAKHQKGNFFLFGEHVQKNSDHAYLRHLSTVDTLGRVSPDISTDTQPTGRPSVGQLVVRANRLSVDTICQYVGRHSADTSVDMLQSTVAGVSVDCW